MKKKHRHILAILLSLLPIVLLGVYAGHRMLKYQAVDTHPRPVMIIVAMSGRSVAVPEKIQRVAALEVLGYEKMFLLGQSDKIALMVSTNAPWMERTNPKVKQIPKFVNEPNAEKLMNMNIDLALFRYNPQKTLDKLSAIEIPGVVSQPAGFDIKDAKTFQEVTKQNLRMYGEIFGGDAKKRAEDWCAYYDEKVNYVTARTATIPTNQRHRAYYLRGPSALITQGHNSNTLWYGEMAGANMVAKNRPIVGQGPVSMEDILLWDPEYIFVGRQYSPDLVLKDERWKDVRAVKEGHVYRDPEGVFFWDGSSEGVLLMEFMAKKLYPKLFPDLDMAKEIHEYYARFYRYNLTEDEVNRILQAKSP
jgi:iron complex transport system substrate-binding protein